MILFLITYWIYLSFATKPIITFDSIDYIDSSKLIPHYFSSLHRELLYPFIISLGIPMNIIGVIILTISVYLMNKIMIKLDIRESIRHFCCLYFGISPSIINSAFSIYSEAIAIPLVLGLILVII